MTRPPTTRRGTTLLEVAAGLAVLALLSAALAAAVAESRRHASLTQNLANLQQFASGTTSYTAEYQDTFWGFSWRQGHEGPFGVAHSETNAMAAQAVDIMRRRGGATLGRVTWSWYPGPLYSHLTLADHLGTDALPAFAAAPEDDLLHLWRRDIFNLSALPDGQRPWGEEPDIQRWAFSSSYELGPAFYNADARWTDGDGVYYTSDQHGLPHYAWSGLQKRIGSRFAHEVSFPSQKVMVHERFQRHFGPRVAFFLYPEARVPVLFADGAAGVRQTADSNQSFRPNAASHPGPTLLQYRPQAWEPPTLSGYAAETLLGHYRWTRGGLKGRDFDAGEIDTSTW